MSMIPLFLLSLMLPAAPQPPAPVVVGRFSAGPVRAGTPPGWILFPFRSVRRHTSYALVADGGTTVLRAEARNGASLLYTRVDLPAADYPIVRWRWKIETTPAGANVRRRSTDDAAARVYVAFRYEPSLVTAWQRFRYRIARNHYGEFPPYAGISYLWVHRTAPGTVLKSPSLSRSIEHVVESGDGRLGQWVTEERDVYADFVRFFGFAPPPISHVAVMTDADDTGATAVASYGDIELLPRAAPAGAVILSPSTPESRSSEPQ